MQKDDQRSSLLEEGFRIGEWLIQPQLNRILWREKQFQVQPKIMCVLVCLAERPGRVVTKEHLFQTVWAGTHVTEHVLSRSISELRNFSRRSAKAASDWTFQARLSLIASVSRVAASPSRTGVGMHPITVTKHSKGSSRAVFQNLRGAFKAPAAGAHLAVALKFCLGVAAGRLRCLRSFCYLSNDLFGGTIIFTSRAR